MRHIGTSPAVCYCWRASPSLGGASEGTLTVHRHSLKNPFWRIVDSAINEFAGRGNQTAHRRDVERDSNLWGPTLIEHVQMTSISSRLLILGVPVLIVLQAGETNVSLIPADWCMLALLMQSYTSTQLVWYDQKPGKLLWPSAIRSQGSRHPWSSQRCYIAAYMPALVVSCHHIRLFTASYKTRARRR